MKKLVALALALALFCGAALAEYWTQSESRPTCCDDRPGCLALQTVMLGTFDPFDPDDSLSVRVFSAALPRLTAVTQDDLSHFSESCGVELERLRECFYIALRNCLWADILLSPDQADVAAEQSRDVLLLFLNPEIEGAQEQMDAIRAHTGPEEIAILAESAGLPVDFVDALIQGDDSQAPAA